MTRIALAGRGWAGGVHAAAVQATPGAELVQVLTRRPSVSSELAEAVGARLGAYDALEAGLDAVIVATPPAHHAAMALAALDTGAAVLVEKPLAANLAEADAMLDAADASGAVCGYAENLLFAPPVTTAFGHIRGLGPLTHLSARAVQPPPDWGYFLEPLDVGGALLDLGAHPLALVLAAAPAQVSAVEARLSSSRPDGADDDATVMLTFADGLRAQVEVGWRAGELHWDLQAASMSGVVRVDLLPEVVVESLGLDVTPAGPASGDGLLHTFGYRSQLRGFLDAVAGRGGNVCPWGFGRQVLEVISAAYLSAGRDEPVELPLESGRDLTPLQLWRA